MTENLSPSEPDPDLARERMLDDRIDADAEAAWLPPLNRTQRRAARRRADTMNSYDRAMAVGKRVLADALAADLAGAIDQARLVLEPDEVIDLEAALEIPPMTQQVLIDAFNEARTTPTAACRIPRVCWYCNNPVPPGDGMYCPDHTEES